MTGPQTHRPPRFEHALLRTIALTAAAVAVLGFAPLAARAATGVSGCSALSGVQVRNTTITAAQYVTSPEGNYCEVSATVAPQHDMRVRLPDDWERRYVQLGGGGFDGSLSNLSNGFGTVGKDPVANGFVVAGSNGGRRGREFLRPLRWNRRRRRGMGPQRRQRGRRGYARSDSKVDSDSSSRCFVSGKGRGALQQGRPGMRRTRWCERRHRRERPGVSRSAYRRVTAVQGRRRRQLPD